MLLAVVACGPAVNAPVPVTGDRGFRAYIKAMDNTLLEINELERMGGGITDRIVLVDGPSLVDEGNHLRYYQALQRNYGRILTLRAALPTSEVVGEVLARGGHTLDEVTAINAMPGGTVVVYVDPRTRNYR